MLLDHIDNLLEFLATHPREHAHGTPLYRFADSVVRYAFHEVKPIFETGRKVGVAELGLVDLPYERMGAVDSVDLFGLDELLMFAFYHRNRGRYARAVDIGANIGLHSILLARCGYKVESYEPDPVHHAKLVRNLDLNGVTECTTHHAAVSERRGTMQFVRVLGNTTSSHLAGSKANSYGELERFDVEVRDIREISERADLMKIDAEGHEAVILNALPVQVWENLDAFVEIGSTENARVIFERFTGTGVNLFPQKTGWTRAESLGQIPVSYKEGGIFISAKDAMPW